MPEINISNLVSQRTGEPLVQIELPHSPAQIDPATAREVSLHIWNAAAAADFDAAFFQTMREFEIDDRYSAAIINRMREIRATSEIFNPTATAPIVVEEAPDLEPS